MCMTDTPTTIELPVSNGELRSRVPISPLLHPPPPRQRSIDEPAGETLHPFSENETQNDVEPLIRLCVLSLC